MATLLLAVIFEEDTWYDFLMQQTEGRFESYPTRWLMLEFASTHDRVLGILSMDAGEFKSYSQFPRSIFVTDGDRVQREVAILRQSHGIDVELYEVIEVEAEAPVLAALHGALVKRSAAQKPCAIPLSPGVETVTL